MGDKHKSEFQKPVTNTLLSGASHGFPFESFQTSSLLIPVSQDSPSVLNDDVGEASKLGAEKVSQLPQPGVTMDNQKNQDSLKNQSQTTSQGYTGIFSSFFGGGSQNKQEQDASSLQTKILEQPPQLSASSTRSSSPFVSISNIQSFSPALQVPTENENERVSSFNPIGNPNPSNSFLPIQDNPTKSPDNSFGAMGFTGQSFKSGDVLNTGPTSKETSRSPENGFANFFTKEATFDANSEGIASNRGIDLAFKLPPKPVATVPLSKAHSAFNLPVERTSESKSYFNYSQSQNPDFSTPTLNQTLSESADSVKYTQPPPLPASKGVPMTAPPISTGTGLKSYRRDHHKRLSYVPVSGLTSNTTISSSYLQPCETFPNSSSLSSPSLTSPAPLRQPLTGSLSQPALNLSTVSSGYSVNTSDSSVQNFFQSQTSSNIVPMFNPADITPSSSSSSLFNSSAIGFLEGSSPDFSSAISQIPSSTPAPQPLMESTQVVNQVALRPPIMSTKEQSVTQNQSASERAPSPSVIPASLNNLANLGHSGVIYRPAYHHWFIKTEADSKESWQPFSMTDSLALEQAFNSPYLTPETVVPTDGGRFDVNVTNRIRTAVYWDEPPKIVRRCSWFYKNSTENKFRPYDENTAYNLEEEYKKAVTSNTWNNQVDLNNGDYVLMYGINSFAHISKAPKTPEGWEAEPDYSQSIQQRTGIVKRGVLDNYEIEDGESAAVDHLIFVVHGIGSVCDFQFRKIEQAVDAFRNKALRLIKSHFRTSMDQGVVNRVEILPVSWHMQLHGETTGVDKKLQTITLKSIPRLRNFTNDTLLDILFYTSPLYCQTIMQQVGGEINSLLEKFKMRNPNFNGGISLVGHSLGSLILFDMLCHQKQPSPHLENIKEIPKSSSVEREIGMVSSADKKKRGLSRNVSYVMGTAGTGQPFIEYPKLTFQPVAFFALGSPIGMFVTVRGIDSLGLDFCLPTCSRFFNVFHPFDPVAYRIEALINPDFADKRPVLIPHHKGRKRMHLELREKMVKVGAHLKQRLVDSVRSTWNTVYHLTMLGRADDELEQEVDQVIEKQLERQRTESVEIPECEETDCNAGRLNLGRRIDYVLQEAPLESFNEYVSAIRSHVIYWDSEDTVLLILKEIYGSMGISSDNESPAASVMPDDPMTPTYQDPTSPFASTSADITPPPMYGFK